MGLIPPRDVCGSHAADRLLSRGRCAAAERVLRCEIGRLRRRGQFRSAGGVALELGHQQLFRGRVAATLAAAVEAGELCRAANWPCGGVASQLLMGRALFEDDRTAEAEATIRLAMSEAVEHAHPACIRAAALSSAHLLAQDRRFADARAALRSVPADPGDPGELWRHADAVADCRAIDSQSGRSLRYWESPLRLLPWNHALLSAEIEIRLALEASDASQAADILARARTVGAEIDAEGQVPLAVCEMLVCAGQGRVSDLPRACAAGLRAARSAHAPVLAVQLRVLYAELLEALDQQKDAARIAARLSLSTWPAPSRLSRKVRELVERLAHVRGEAVPLVHGPGIQLEAADVLAILESCVARDDDHQSLENVCRTLRTSLGAAGVAVFGGTSRSTLIAFAGVRTFAGGLIGRVLATGRASEAADVTCRGETAVPICCGPAMLGVLAAKWSSPPTSLASRNLALLRSAASAVVPAVRALAEGDQAQPQRTGVLAEIAGSSTAVAELRQSVVGAASAPFPVLIQGESGSGKELVAKAIHAASARRARRFCAVNCAALPDELCEAELFGHARGAFTGAATDRAGLFEDADGGTLFLDEVGELSLRAQAKLLRVIQDGEVRRLGENTHRRVDPRIVAASNRSLGEEVDAGRFRHDLLFRLDVIRIRVPSLRERQEDIPCLVAQIWRTARERVTSRAELSLATVEALTRYRWPGNVRELQNVLFALAATAPRCGRLGPDRLPGHITLMRPSSGTAPTLEDGRREFERRFVREALARAGGRQTRAAEQLGVTRQGLAKLLARLEIKVGADARDGGPPER